MATRSQPWHSLRDFKDGVDTFHETNARSPPESVLKPAKKHLTGLATGMRDHMRTKEIVKDVEFQGSIYEGIKTVIQTLEFDCLVVLKYGEHLRVIQDEPGFVRLQVVRSDSPLWKIANTDGFLSISKMRQNFLSNVTKALNDLSVRREEVRVRAHGPAVQLDVHKPDGSLWYELDFVPGFKPDNQVGYIAKSYDGDNDLAWRRSFSREERNILDTCDRGNKCHKEVIRIIKAMREFEAPLKGMESYIIKTTLLHMLNDSDYDARDWNRSDRALRLIDMLSQLHGYLSAKRLPHRFVPQMNLLKRYSTEAVNNMACRVKELLRSKDKMMKLLRKRNDAIQSRVGGVFCSSPARQEYDEYDDMTLSRRLSSLNVSTSSSSDEEVGYSPYGTARNYGGASLYDHESSYTGFSHAGRGRADPRSRSDERAATNTQASLGSGMGWLGAIGGGLLAVGLGLVAAAAIKNEMDEEEEKQKKKSGSR